MSPSKHLSLLFLLSAPICAQVSVVVPKGSNTASPGYYTAYIFYGTTSTSLKSESRAQSFYGAGEFSNVTPIGSIQYRRPQNLGNQNKVCTGNLRVWMEGSSVAPQSASTTFATNRNNPTLVFSGSYNLPDRNRGTTWPDPWEAAITFNQTTSVLFVPQAHSSLMVETEWSNSTGTSPWYLESSRADNGVRATNLSASGHCRPHSDGGYSNSLSYRSPIVGGQWYLQYSGMPSNVPSMSKSFMLLSAAGVGASHWGRTLPFSIDSLGVPGLTTMTGTCQLAVKDDIYLPLTYTPNTTGTKNRGTLRSPTVTIPNVPAAAGATFYDQGICFDTDPTTKQEKLVTTWSSRWTVGSGTGEDVSMVYRPGDITQTTGYLRKYEAPTAHFQ